MKKETTLPDVTKVRESDFASDIDTNPPVRKFTGTCHSVNLFRRRYTEHPNRLSNASQMADSVLIQKMWTTARPVQCCQKKKETLSQYEYFNNLNRSTFRLEYKICQASDVRIIKGDKRQGLVLQD